MRLGLQVVIVGAAIVFASVAAAQDSVVAAQPVAVLPEQIIGDAVAGEQVFRRCQACHDVGDGAENKVGPMLTGVVGRPAGIVPDFDYSDAMREAAASGLVWTVADLQAFLEKPRDKVPGTRMSFPGLRSEEQRNDVIAFLHAHPASGQAQ